MTVPDMQEGYNSTSYLTKPFSGSVLLARIDNLLRSRTMLRSLFAGDKKEQEEEELLGAQDQTFVGKLRDVIRRNLSDSDFSVERIGEEIGSTDDYAHRPFGGRDCLRGGLHLALLL